MIPNQFHFIYFYKPEVRQFPLAHYLCLNSARMLNEPDNIYFYSDSVPEGPYWEKIRKYIKFIKIQPPTEIFGNKLYHIAHKSDVLRLQILMEHGGIYLDMDVLCKKSFKSLLNQKFVLGRQGKYRNMGLCNGVILADKDSEFLKIWYNEFRNFRSKGNDKYWAEMSVRKPLELSKKYPELIHVEPYDSFHYPLYYQFDLKKIFEKNIDYTNAFCHHYWDGASKDKYISKLTEEQILNSDTTFNLIARKFL